MRKFFSLIGVLVLFAALAAPHASAKAKPVHPARFGPPVKVTPDLGYGYEPSVFSDRFGNLFATAHKENWELAISPDTNSPTATRSMSWAWWSTDDGTTWGDIPGLPADLENHQFGDEGDMAIDDADHLYFMDTAVADNSITEWTISGRGQIAINHTRQAMPTAQPVDDRPWITAHGDGHAYAFSNEGNRNTYPLGQGEGSGGGRYTVYRSTDGGMTFDPLGFTLPESGWCRPAADHAAGSLRVYAACTDDTTTLNAYVSENDGTSFGEYRIATVNGDNGYPANPSIQVAPNGWVFVLYADPKQTGVGHSLLLFRSRDHGKTWQKKDVTPKTGFYEYPWLSVSRNGKKLGFGTYYRASGADPWRVYGAIWPSSWSAKRPVMISLDEANPVDPVESPHAPGDYLASEFAPDGHLGVIWTRNVMYNADLDRHVERDIYFARSLTT